MQFLNKTLYTALLTFLWLLPVNAHAQTCSPEDRTCPSGMWCNVESRYTGNCVAKLPDGTPCNGSFQCASDSCAASPSGTFTCGGVNPPGTGDAGTAPFCPGGCAAGTHCEEYDAGGGRMGAMCVPDNPTGEYGPCLSANGYVPQGTTCSPNQYGGSTGVCDGAGLCVPEMSDYLAVAFVIVTGGAVYYMRRRKMKSPQ